MGQTWKDKHCMTPLYEKPKIAQFINKEQATGWKGGRMGNLVISGDSNSVWDGENIPEVGHFDGYML